MAEALDAQAPRATASSGVIRCFMFSVLGLMVLEQRW